MSNAFWTGHVLKSNRADCPGWAIYAKCPPGHAPAEWDRAKQKAGWLQALPWPLDGAGAPLDWADVEIEFDESGQPKALVAKRPAAPAEAAPATPDTYVSA
jgi:hypothetical protein